MTAMAKTRWSMTARRLVLWAAAAAMASSAARADGADTKFARSRGEHAPYRLTTPHFEVEFSIAPSAGQRYAVLCERAYANFRKKFNVAKDDVVWEGKCRVKIFADHADFAAFAQKVHKSHAAAESGGYTRITRHNPDIVLFLKDGNHPRLQQVLVHEMTHVFLQLFHNEAKIETWLHEGFAQHFEFQVNTLKSRLKDSRRRVKRQVAKGTAKPLRDFWEGHFPATDLESYAQAWSLVEFMVAKGSAKRTGAFILKIKDGEDQQVALAETFGCSPEKFEKMWKRYVAKTY